MAKMAFNVAVKAAVEEEDREAQEEREPWFEFTLLEQEFKVWEMPSRAQSVALLAGMVDSTAEFYRAVLAYAANNIENGVRIKRMLEANLITWELVWGGDEENEHGIIDTIVNLVTENPTGEPSGSSTSSPATGKRSTGRSPAKASTRSAT